MSSINLSMISKFKEKSGMPSLTSIDPTKGASLVLIRILILMVLLHMNYLISVFLEEMLINSPLLPISMKIDL